MPVPSVSISASTPRRPPRARCSATSAGSCRCPPGPACPAARSSGRGTARPRAADACTTAKRTRVAVDERRYPERHRIGIRSGRARLLDRLDHRVQHGSLDRARPTAVDAMMDRQVLVHDPAEQLRSTRVYTDYPPCRHDRTLYREAMADPPSGDRPLRSTGPPPTRPRARPRRRPARPRNNHSSPKPTQAPPARAGPAPRRSRLARHPVPHLQSQRVSRTAFPGAACRAARGARRTATTAQAQAPDHARPRARQTVALHRARAAASWILLSVVLFFISATTQDGVSERTERALTTAATC